MNKNYCFTHGGNNSQVLKKSSDNEIISNPYPNAEAEREFQKMVFNPDVFTTAMTGGTMPTPKQTQTPSSTSMKPVPTIEELNERKNFFFETITKYFDHENVN